MGSTTSLVARQCRLRQWADQILDCQNRPRDMTVDQWCAREGLTKANYYYRLRQVRQACLDQIPEEITGQTVVPVSSELLEDNRPTPPAGQSSNGHGIDVYCGNFCIRVAETVSPELLEMVLKVASHVE